MCTSKPSASGMAPTTMLKVAPSACYPLDLALEPGRLIRIYISLAVEWQPHETVEVIRLDVGRFGLLNFV